MENNNEQDDSGAGQVVVSAGHQQKNRKKQLRPVIAVVLVVAVVATAGGVEVRWLQQSKQKAAMIQHTISKDASRAQDLTLSGEYEEAHKALKAALSNPNLSADEKYDLLFQQGTTYENQQNYGAALTSYKQAESVRLTMVLAEAIARVAEANGDKQMAIAYYKKAIPLIPTDDPTGASIKRYYQDSIIRLGGRP